MFKYQLTKTVFPNIKKNTSLLDKSERFALQLQARDPSYKLPENCKWSDLFLQLDNAPSHCKKSGRKPFL